MSCNISWDSFEKGSFLSWSKELLYDALNSGKRPHILSSEIKIKELTFGKQSPSFEVLEVGDLANDRFRGIFKLKYDGDANITLNTSIQANLLNIYEKSTQEFQGQFALPNFKLASQPFSLPLNVNLSNIKLSGIIVVVFSKSKGLTLVFKNDPLENIKVSSTFDTVPVIEKFLQKQIENQIRDLFRDILPSVLHKVSQKWTTNNIISQLHSKINEQNNEGLLNKERVSIFEVNPSEPELSPANMLKLSTLTTSRQSFRLSIPPLHDVIERPSLYKFELKSSLGKNLELGTKKIPIEIFSKNHDDFQIKNTLNTISRIQSKYYSNEKNNHKLKRRSIKMNSKKTKNPTPPRSVSMNTEATLVNDDQEDEIQLKEQPIIIDSKKNYDIKNNYHLDSAPLLTPSPINLTNPLLNRPPLTPIHTHHHSSADIFHYRSHSPRKSQSYLLNVGIGINNYGFLEAPPPYH
ncbi:hypothetical protein WICANDRAFT_62518 [Wickerhamomyces anomalus NRRL Y-366-8]|uniref:Mitochondrial distribution and morphology protein 34 n=1 Tax=Wickerhamomyces anomalus (strain ATCC 58044 / CBS 1984 / NCYC 433 / NRRL Y-366-8) TaxID=683960 RepID=A0A1E3P4X0_WICAA|nr:uncharacterized protein WICANDRAFT_62518 [Wickerhamomyces anomalus NRRL Y-366-8]ODQ59942.1 hypothetical protein WICANDRAFT_62518 [Wickerhamomyces anomalus NRRL Y-366-8]